MKNFLLILLFTLVMSQSRNQRLIGQGQTTIKTGYDKKVADFENHVDSAENNMVSQIKVVYQHWIDFINASIDEKYQNSVDICELVTGGKLECDKLVDKLKSYVHPK